MSRRVKYRPLDVDELRAATARLHAGETIKALAWHFRVPYSAMYRALSDELPVHAPVARVAARRRRAVA